MTKSSWLHFARRKLLRFEKVKTNFESTLRVAVALYTILWPARFKWSSTRRTNRRTKNIIFFNAHLHVRLLTLHVWPMEITESWIVPDARLQVYTWKDHTARPPRHTRGHTQHTHAPEGNLEPLDHTVSQEMTLSVTPVRPIPTTELSAYMHHCLTARV